MQLNGPDKGVGSYPANSFVCATTFTLCREAHGKHSTVWDGCRLGAAAKGQVMNNHRTSHRRSAVLGVAGVAVVAALGVYAGAAASASATKSTSFSKLQPAPPSHVRNDTAAVTSQDYSAGADIASANKNSAVGAPPQSAPTVGLPSAVVP